MARRSKPVERQQAPTQVFPFSPPEGAIGCPVRASLDAVGHKWALVVLRDVAFLPNSTFSQILHRSEGLTPRILAARLNELRSAGIIEKVADPSDERVFHYRLTDVGRDTVPVLSALAAFGMKHLSQEVFADGRPRTFQETFPNRAKEFLGLLYDYARMDLPAVRRNSFV
jgi:DNA-binding HxlR family transcriptional regulator